jgi:hypothetical protein
MSGLRVREGLTVRTLPEGDAVVAGGEGMDAVIVNASAHAILDLLTEIRTEDEIAAVFCETFPDQDPSSVRRDVAEIVGQLMRAGIVEACGSEPSTA